MTNSPHQFFATAAKGIEQLVADELHQLGAENIKVTRAGVSFTGNLETAYRSCLWLRTANRLLMPILTFMAQTPEELYRQIGEIDWSEHLDSTGSLAVDFNASQSAINHSHFGAQKVKDAIVDQLRDRHGTRPSVDLKTPDLRLNVYLFRDQATVSIDLSGDSLHRRGYRQPGVSAPLKENLAAAILIRAGWPEIAANGGSLIDPMCGSGTLPIEAALMAANSAPGLLREYYGFLRWKGHQPDLWDHLLTEAEQSEIEGLANLPFIVGYDADSRAIANASKSCEKAGLQTKIHFEKREFANALPHPKMKGKPGLVVFNPPYGVRLGELDVLKSLYASIGTQLKKYFPSWQASVFTGNLDLGKQIGIRAHKKYALFNGAIPCTLLNFHVVEGAFLSRQNQSVVQHSPSEKKDYGEQEIAMFANRIHKNLKKLKNWVKQNQIHCYRIYDKDIPDYAVSIDLYGNFAHVQEYKPPDTVDPRKAAEKIEQIKSNLPAILGIPSKHIFLKVRQKQTGANQYQKRQDRGEFFEVSENNCRFLVNFTDYLDTGLFLDHRPTRELIGKLAAGKRFLNLFSYSGTATVYAAKGGARSTVSVDSSRHYLNWAKKNLALNGFSGAQHRFEQADCLPWLEAHKYSYDLIFLDPPTFSNSKSRRSDFDLQKDHVQMIEQTVKLLDWNGILIFSNNFRKFKLDKERLSPLIIEDITQDTIPPDFARNPKIHYCWRIRKK